MASVSPTSRRRSSTSRWPTSRSASLTPWWVYSERPVISIVTDSAGSSRSSSSVVVVVAARRGPRRAPRRPSLAQRSSRHRERIAHRRDVVHAEHARAALEREHVGGDRAGEALGGATGSLRPRASATMRPRKLLREVPITSGRPSAASSSRRRSSSRLCSTVLPKPMPGSSMIRSLGDAPPRRANARRSSRNARRRRRRRRSADRCCIVRGSPSMCIRQHSAPPAATSSAISGSARSAVTSLTRLAPAAERRARDGRLGGVDRDLRALAGHAPRRCPRSPARRGAAPRARATGSAPGRVDSPPTSRISAPSPTSSQRRARRGVGVEERAAVGERVGRHVEIPIRRNGRVTAARKLSGSRRPACTPSLPRSCG